MALYNEGLFATIANNVDTLSSSGNFSIKPVRTKFVFLDLNKIKDKYPKIYKKYEKDFPLGGILFDSVTNPSPDITKDGNYSNYKFARPLFPNIVTTPLVNEIVYIISLPTVDMQNPQFVNLNATGFYYFQPINLFNNVHYNALPNPLINNTLPNSQNKTYSQVNAGSTNKTTNQPAPIFLGETFKPRKNIKNLLPFEGDIIYEGRWGQSIRFGSTVKEGNNNWSSAGENGDPILIIRNGQKSIDSNSTPQNPAWEPTTENINADSGSIYFGTTQKIPLEASSTTYDSYKQNAPTIPNEYTSNQIIINSGRVVINTFEDHILLTSKKSINLNAVSSVNIDTPTAVFQTDKIYLGDKDATEPLLLGNATVDLLSKLVTSLQQFVTVCSTLTQTIPPGVPLPALNQISTQVLQDLNSLQANLGQNSILKSKDNFTV